MDMELLRDDVVPEQKNEEINGEEMLVNNVDEPNNSGLLNESNVANGGIKDFEPSTGSVPKDAVDEWPEPKQNLTFYFVKYRSYEDPKLKAKLDQADKEVLRKTQARTEITEALKAKRYEKADIISQLKPLQAEQGKFRTVMNEKRKEMEPLQAALGKLRGTKIATTEKGVGLCSSEEELNEFIQSLQYRIQHESNTLTEEKQLLKEIKQLEASREKVIANAAMRAKIHESFGQRDAIQDQVKLIGSDLDGVKKEQQAIGTQIKHLEEKKNAIMMDIESLSKDLENITENRTKAYQTLTMLRKERDESNAFFFQYRSLMNNAKGLAATKDIAALEELAHNEVEKFMSQWSSSKAFRDDYERRILSSLDFRQLSRDGRMRNPDEKSIVSEVLVSTEVANGSAKASMKKEKENVIPPQHEEVKANKVQEQVVKPSEVRERRKASDAEKADAVDKSEKETSNENVIDTAKLKELKREEEIAKAKLAMERKKKLAEKAAAKATARAQKEFEKKQKEKDKKARKKAAASSQSGGAEQLETEMRDIEQEQEEEPKSNSEVPTPEKSKEEQKEKAIKLRSRMKSQNQIPKIILKKKKSHSYWLWAASAAIFALLLVVFAYFYSI